MAGTDNQGSEKSGGQSGFAPEFIGVHPPIVSEDGNEATELVLSEFTDHDGQRTVTFVPTERQHQFRQ
jgi:hypothetical protein